MRILRVAQETYPEVMGGGAYHIHAMSRDQAAMGHDVTLVTVDREDKPKREGRHGYTVIRKSVTFELLNNQFSLDLANYLRTVNDHDIVHAHSHSYFATTIAALMSKRFQAPLAITNHSLDTQRAPPWLSATHLRTMGRWTLNQADVVFCYTEEEKKRARRLGITGRIEVISNGINHNRFTPEGETSPLIDPNVTSVLFVGRLVDGKRPQDVIKAFAKVDSRNDACLYLCGDGPLRAELEALAGSHGVKNIDFFGEIPYEDIPSLYRSADVVVLPSRVEGVPRVVLEALATETPVVTSELPQIESLVTQAGFTVPVEKPSELADALSELLSDPELRTMLGEKGRQLIKESYTWEDTVNRTTQILQQVSET